MNTKPEDVRFTSDITVKLLEHVGGDAMIANAARVSTIGHQSALSANDSGDVAGLLSYLMRHRHGSPFEHGSMTFLVRAPIFVWREWHRHRIGFSYNEESARYKKLEPEFYLPEWDRPCLKVEGWKPGRPKFKKIEGGTPGVHAMAKLRDNLRTVYFAAYEAYEQNLELSMDPGLARACLPVGIYSSCWVTCNPRSLMAFLSLRTHDPAANQISYPLYEIEVAARIAESIFASYWPLTHQAFVDCGRTAP